MLLILTTTPSKKEADSITRALLESRLCACVQRNRIKSHYTWQGKLCKEREYRLSIKTTREHKEAVVRCIEKQSSYELPQILILEAQASETYAQWVLESCIH